MALQKIDHVAIEVASVDDFIEKLARTGGVRLLRRGTAVATGRPIAMLGDRTGMKVELIENPDVSGVSFSHLAFGTDNIDASLSELTGSGWTLLRGPGFIPAAKAKSALLTGRGLEFQVLEYAPDSPDLATW